MRSRLTPVLIGSALLLLLPAPSTQSFPLRFSRDSIAVSTDPVPGGAGEPFGELSFAPFLDRDGNVLFRAADGLWHASAPGAISKIVRAGDVAPGLVLSNGTPATFATVPAFSAAFVPNALAETAFDARLQGIGSSVSLWKGKAGRAPTLITSGRFDFTDLTGTRVNGFFGARPGDLHLNERGELLFNTRFGSRTLVDGLFAGTSRDDLRALVFTGSEAAGVPAGTAGFLKPVYDRFFASALTPDGDAYFVADVADGSLFPPPTPGTRRGAWVARENTLTLLALEGSPATGLPGRAFGRPLVTATRNGDYLIQASAPDPGDATATAVTGLWLGTRGVGPRLLLASAADGSRSTPTDVGNVSFTLISSFFLALNGDVLFFGFTDVGVAGLWRANDFGVSPIVLTGERALGATFDFDAFQNFAVNKFGGVAFIARGRLFGQKGLFATEPRGEIRKIIEVGDEIRPDTVVTDVVFAGDATVEQTGSRAGFNDAGTVTFLAHLETRDPADPDAVPVPSSAIFRASFGFTCPDGTAPDRDGDAILDCWEEDGIDWNEDGTVDLPLHQPPFDADPDRKDLYLEIDYLDCAHPQSRCTAGDRHNHRPADATLRKVQRAFTVAPVNNGTAAEDGAGPRSCSDGIDNGGGDGADGDDPECRGVRLHFLGQNGFGVDEAIPETAATPLRFHDRGDGPLDDFDDLKLGNPAAPCGTGPSDAHFGLPDDRSAASCPNVIEARRLVFRYGIFGHEIAACQCSGIAEIGGNDFFMGLGTIDHDFAEGIQMVSGILMHEFGHTLGLRHGGLDDTNCKPNYLSVMNYSLTIRNIAPDRPLDYSRERRSTLDENKLDEATGIGGPVLNRSVVFGSATGTAQLATDAGSIDWNGNGNATDTEVGADVSGVAVYASCLPRRNDGTALRPRTVLQGFDDWSHLSYGFRASADFADGPRTTLPPDPAILDSELLEAARTTDFDGDGTSNLDDRCPVVEDPSQADSDGDGIGDACECGDFDGNGRVNTADARLVQRCAVGQIPCSGLCDVTGDGACNTADARLIQRLAVGQLTKADLRCAERP